MNQPLSRQDIDLMMPGIDAFLVYIDSIAEDKIETFEEVFFRVLEAKFELKGLDIDVHRRHLEN